jgi:hypothetical protein
MAKAIIAVGFDHDDKPVQIYTGDDFDSAQKELMAQGEAGKITLGHIYKYPQPTRRVSFSYVKQAQEEEAP